MTQPTTTPFSRDFILMVIGQIASIFGNAILRFALALYVLDKTGSAGAFGTLLAVSMLPTILCSPFGGILADRVSRKWMMVVLDFLTSGMLVVFALLPSMGVGAVAALLILLTLIQAFYQPAVQSSIPLLVPAERLEQGNGIVIQVNALAQLLGPILGGMLYGFFGLSPILIAGIACFAASAVMEIFLHIPFVKKNKGGGVLGIIRGDLGSAFHFLSRENPGLLQILGLIAALNLFLSAMMMVGLPYLVKEFLGLSSQLYGFVEGAMAAGSILGGLLVGKAAQRITLERSSILLYGTALCTLPIALSVVGASWPLVSYGVILVSVAACMFSSTLFSIIAQSYMQKHTPEAMLGKIMSLVVTVCTCAMPLGQALYGWLFNFLGRGAAVAVLLSGIATALIAFMTHRALRQLQQPAEPPLAE